MTEALTAGRLGQALRATAELAELDELAEYPARVASLLRELIGADHAGYNALNLADGSATVVTDPDESVFPGGPEELARLGHQNPMIAHHLRTVDPSALRLSDFIGHRALHRTELYQNVYKIVGLEYQLAIRLPSPRRELGRPRELVGLSLGRSARDFTTADRLTLEAIGPHLSATLERLHRAALQRATFGQGAESERAVALVDHDESIVWVTRAARSLGLTPGARLPPELRRWLAAEPGPRRPLAQTATIEGRRTIVRLVPDGYPELHVLHITPVQAPVDPAKLRSVGLTVRETHVMALALGGETNASIAGQLGLSPRTVEKHFERIYSRLDVKNRTQAIVTCLALLNG